MSLIVLDTKIAAPVGICFDLSRSIDLHMISTRTTHEKAIAGVTTGLINLNETVTWRARHFGVMWKLTTVITEFHRPGYFVDEMSSGIFESMHHRHDFVERDGITTMTDRFKFESPMGFLGRVVNWTFLESYMTGFLKERNTVIKEYAENEQWRDLIAKDFADSTWG